MSLDKSTPNIFPIALIIGLSLSFALYAFITAVAIDPAIVSFNSLNESFNTLGKNPLTAPVTTIPKGLAAKLFPIPESRASLTQDPIPVLSIFSVFCFISLRYSAIFIVPLDVNTSLISIFDDVDFDFGVYIDF